MKRLELHPLVHKDLQDALDYYGQISNRLEDRFWEEFSNAVKNDAKSYTTIVNSRNRIVVN